MDLLNLVKTKKVLLAAHRGVAGGNIPCNSLQAFQIALNQGADIIELDVERSADGDLFVQHPGMERVHLRMRDSIKHYPTAVVEQMVLSNCDLNRTEWKIVRFEDALRMLKGKCIVNIDKFCENPEAIAKAVRALGMEDQVLIKTAPKPQYLDAVEQYAPDFAYMSMTRNSLDFHEELKKRHIHYVGAEVLFDREDASEASKEYIDMMHGEGRILWSNAIVYNYRDVLSAYHNDDVSLLEDPEKGWGWLADRGYDIIQTDHLLPCRLFLEETNRRTK